jgi:glycosyltransferase involved in cell wall biosynthesis
MKIHFLCNDGSPIDVVWSDMYGRGVGGAELALLSLAEALVKEGHKVTVYNQTREERNEQGIKFANLATFNREEKKRNLIIFRSPSRLALGASADRLLWWSTDQFTIGDFRALSYMVDFVVTISPYHTNYHKSKYGIPDAKIAHLDLGVRDEYPKWKDMKKTKNSLIFCSIPDRGLGPLHAAWPLIKRDVPDATLTITSDYRLWGNLSPGNHKHRMLWIEHEGVSFLGKVPRHDLVQLQCSAEILAYPCTYEELFCVSVAECEVAGAYPVTTGIGSLSTTNRFGTIIPGDAKNSGFNEEFANRIVSLLTDDRKFLEERQEKMSKEAREIFSWSSIAKRWLELIEDGSIIDEGSPS